MELRHVEILFQVIVFLFAISVHESAHAWTASRLGDPTAQMLGRVTLNPLRHIDPVGTVILPLLALMANLPMIGWAKPVPVDPRNFRNEVRDDILTSVAGPVSNFLVVAIALLLLIGIAFLPGGSEAVWSAIQYTRQQETDSNSPMIPASLLLLNAVMLNTVLAVFNLIPVPPLDGSHVLRHMLSEGARRIYDTVGIVGLVMLFAVGGQLLGYLVAPFFTFYSVLIRSILS
jgi:Zn-dependent protease